MYGYEIMNSIRRGAYSVLRNYIIEILFLIITSMSLLASFHRRFQYSSLVYNNIQLIVLSLNSIQLLFCKHVLVITKYKYNRMVLKMEKHFEGLDISEDKISLKNLEVFGNILCIFCINVLLKGLATNIVIMNRVLEIICYTGQKFIELCFIICLRKIDKINLRNLERLSPVSNGSGKSDWNFCLG